MRTYILTATKAILALSIGLLMVPDSTLRAQPGAVLSHQKISDTEGGFTGTLDDDDIFGADVAAVGDLDGDGIQDLAVGAALDGRRRLSSRGGVGFVLERRRHG